MNRKVTLPEYVIPFIYSLVYHTGRRSSNEYSTLVLAAVRYGHIGIPLTYGSRTDWLLNVQAVGESEGRNKGQLGAAAEPEIVVHEKAFPDFPVSLRWAFERARIESYLRLKIE